MEAVRGVIEETPVAFAATGCRPPHLAQKMSLGATWFPQLEQKGIRIFIRYGVSDCSANALRVGYP